jgi:hypothetical protein
MTADGNFNASPRTPINGWMPNQLLSFSTQGGISISSRPEPELSVIAMNQNHRLYGITAEGAAIIEYE